MDWLTRINEINARLKALNDEVSNATAERLGDIQKEVNSLTEERSKILQAQQEETRKAFNASTKVELPTEAEKRKKETELIEERARNLKQGRAISIGALDIVHIEHVNSQNLNPAFQQVSDIVDLVKITALQGGESYEQGYEKGNGVAGYTAEGGTATTSEPKWGKARIGKAKITALTEVPEEMEKLAPAMYIESIKRNLSASMRKKLAQEILSGDGAADHLTGIFGPASAIEATKDLSLSAIDENTLDEIVLSYGGEENVSSGVLILSKADLKAFAKVRGTDKKKVYDINYANKTIDGIPYVISSECVPLATATAGEFSMAYGSLNNYELVSFSPVELARSVDQKFSTGQVVYKAVGFFGGNVTSWNGFLRVKKSA